MRSEAVENENEMSLNKFVNLETINWTELNRWDAPLKSKEDLKLFTVEEVTEIDKTNIYRRQLMENGNYIARQFDNIADEGKNTTTEEEQ